VIEYTAEFRERDSLREYCLETRRESVRRQFRDGEIGEVEYRSRLARVDELANGETRNVAPVSVGILARERRLLKVGM